MQGEKRGGAVSIDEVSMCRDKVMNKYSQVFRGGLQWLRFVNGRGP